MKTRQVFVQTSVLNGTSYVVGVFRGICYWVGSDIIGIGGQTFEDHKVAVGNLLGKINEGFKTLMLNFNREVGRLEPKFLLLTDAESMTSSCSADDDRHQLRPHVPHRLRRRPTLRPPPQDLRQAPHRPPCHPRQVSLPRANRASFSTCANPRSFRLPRFAQMARQIEALQAWTESIYYQMEMMPDHLKDMRMGGACALLKLQGTRTFEYCAREACQIMGGISYTRGGQGGRVERLYREVRGAAIPGGSEEIMADIGGFILARYSRFGG